MSRAGGGRRDHGLLVTGGPGSNGRIVGRHAAVELHVTAVPEPLIMQQYESVWRFVESG